jgi:hypothetical protein
VNWLTRYRAHPDAATQAANVVALIVGGNGPFYPLYVWLIVRPVGAVVLLSMLATPVFLSIPWIARRNGLMGRVVLVATGAANTVWCSAVFGADSGVSLFLLPCLVLVALLWRKRALRLGCLGLVLVAQQITLHWPWPPLAGLDMTQQASLYVMNVTSVGMLLSVLALMVPDAVTARPNVPMAGCC